MNTLHHFRTLLKSDFNKHKKHHHLIIATFVVLVTLGSGIFLYKKFASAATFTFAQSSWSGGATANTAVHPTNQSSWSQYASATNVTAGATVALPSTSYAFTDDGATSTTPTAPTTGGGFANGTNSSTAVSGSGTGAAIALGINGTVAQVSEGSTTTCTVKTDGTVYCWGNNGFGQIGDNTTTQRNTPIQVLGVGGTGNLTGVAQISAGGNGTTCAVKTDGTAYCWGNNGNGQIGDNTTAQRNTPVQVLGVGGTGNLTGVTQISEGSSSTCAVKTDGTAYCWGYNGAGQIGDNTTAQRKTPVQVLGVGGTGNLTGVAQISNGGSTACAVKTDGTAYCWGWNGQGQIGDNTTVQSYTPVQVHGVGDSGYLTSVAQISIGEYTACAVKTDGTAYCWGDNGLGQIGDNTTTQRNTPVSILLWDMSSAGTLALGTTGYYTSGTFTSAVINTGGKSAFTTLVYTTTLNSQTITMDVRAGNIATPDGSWTAWQTSVANDGSISGLAGTPPHHLSSTRILQF